jgi:hypothetical protein
MPLPLIGKDCRVESVSDEEGARLLCLSVDRCPLGHPGTLTRACFGSNSHVVVRQFGRGIKRPRTHVSYGDVIAVDNEKEESSYEPVEEAQKVPPAPVKEPDEPEEEVEEFAEAETVIAEFESQNEYVFALDVIKSTDGDKYVQLTIDNVDITVPLEDFMELLLALGLAAERLQKIALEG